MKCKCTIQMAVTGKMEDDVNHAQVSVVWMLRSATQFWWVHQYHWRSNFETTNHSSNFYLISSLVIVRLVKKEWIYLLAVFCGMDLYNRTTEKIVANLNSFLQHYNTVSSLWIMLTTTLKNLQLELGVRKYPLLYDYNTLSGLVTNSWIKSLWGKVNKLGIDIDVSTNILTAQILIFVPPI